MDEEFNLCLTIPLVSLTNRWAHQGEDVCYYQNTRTYTPPTMRSKATPRHYFTLSWVHTFRHPGDRVFFAHCYPYTYTDMRRDLLHLVDDSRTRPFCRTRTLGHSIAGNAVPLLTITSHTHDPAVLIKRPAIVITARWVAHTCRSLIS